MAGWVPGWTARGVTKSTAAQVVSAVPSLQDDITVITVTRSAVGVAAFA